MEDEQQDTALISSRQCNSVFGTAPFTEAEGSRISQVLSTKLGKSNLSYRKGAGNRNIAYLESGKAIELANRAFDFNGWSCHIQSCTEEYVISYFV